MTRYYEVDGVLCESVTTALSVLRKPGLEYWRGKHGNETADSLLHEAGDLGSYVHDLCEMVNKGEPWEVRSPNSDIWCMVSAYEEWFAANVKQVLGVEKVVANELYRYAGRLDLEARLKGDRTGSVIDIKTGKTVYPDTALQLSAYVEALAREGKKPKRRLVVHIDKINPGKLTIKEYPAECHDRDYRMFLYALELYRYFSGGAKPDEIIKIRRETA